MTSKSFFIPVIILILLRLSSFPSNPAYAGVFNPESFTLENGMQVVVIPNHRVPIVTHMVWYKVGSADEPRGKSGIAHFFEHLMFKATKNLKSGEFSKTVARNGGRDNAFTSYDYTGYHQNVAVDRLPIVMKLEADRMRNLIIDKDQIEPERQVVLEERRSRTDNSPAAKLGEQINAALFINYPYRDPIIGWDHEIRGLSVEDLLTFYDAWYRPNNAILVVAGDVTAAKLRPLAEKYYGVIAAKPVPPRTRTMEPPHNTARRVILRDVRVRQPSWRRLYLAPSLSYGETKHAYPLEVLAQILGGGTTSRLYRSLVVDKKLAISAGAFYSGGDLGPSRFGYYASPRPGISMDQLEEAMNNEITNLLNSGVTEKEVSRAISTMQAEAIYARDSIGVGARVLGSALASGLTVEDVESWPDRIGAVTVVGINEAAKAVFDEKHSVTGLLISEAPSKVGKEK